MNATLLLDYLAICRQQQETHIQMLRNESTLTERSYNLLFSHISHNPRTHIDEMTGILSSISNLSTIPRGRYNTRRRNNFPSSENPARQVLAAPLTAPSLATHLRSSINRSTNTYPERPRPPRSIFRETSYIFPTTTFDNTTIRQPPPTLAEIEISTLSCKYLDVSTNQIICPITRTNFENNDDILKIIHCNHIFKKESLLTWFQTKQTCPICRHNITQNTTPTSLPPIR